VAEGVTRAVSTGWPKLAGSSTARRSLPHISTPLLGLGNRLLTLGECLSRFFAGSYDCRVTPEDAAVAKRASRVTIRDVAAATSLSTATVSRALSGRRPVSPEIASAVREASERLGYRPDALAQSLRQQRTNAVGMLVPKIANPLYPLIMEAAERQLHSHGYELFLCDSQEDPDLEAIRAQALVDRRVDGILIIPCGAASAETVRAVQRNAPVVQVDRFVEGAKADFVGIDGAAGIILGLEHLDSIGRQRLAFVGADSMASAHVERLNAFGTGAAQRSAAGATGVILLGEPSIAWGREAADRLVAADLPNGILCATDEIAIGVVQGLRAHAVTVPDDVAVVGFDDSVAELGNPPLTTIRQPTEELGRQAAELLMSRLMSSTRDEPPHHLRLMPALIVRGSTVASAN
jgi:LacI family transcriptional regulator